MTIRYGGIDKRDVAERLRSQARRLREKGLTRAAIAAQMDISEWTVGEYVKDMPRPAPAVPPLPNVETPCNPHPTPDLWFSEEDYRASREAKALCEDCPLRTECLEYALLTAQKYGVWGGLTTAERTRLRKQRSQLRVVA